MNNLLLQRAELLFAARTLGVRIPMYTYIFILNFRLFFRSSQLGEANIKKNKHVIYPK